MKRFLLVTAAAVSLSFAGASFAQTGTEPVPTPPPVETPAQTPDPVAQPAQSPLSGPAAAEAQAQAADNAESMAASPASEAAPAPAVMAQPPTAPTFASAGSVCQPRVTSVHFGRGTSLSQQNQNAIEQAVDAASVCSLQQVVIADSGQGSRRAQAVRATLVRQGVPADLIRIDTSVAPAEGASTGQLDVRMNFAGIASTDVPAATAAMAPATPEVSPEQTPEDVTNEAEQAPGT